jgi:hypothetical protein
MAGINLMELEARDMLDVLHYLLEEDLNVSTAEQVDAKSQVRESIYKNIYNRTYKYSMGKSGSSNNYQDFDNIDDPVNMPPANMQTKPYMPPTNFDPDAANPFGNVLRETPLG